jgi:hypothetical protein
MTTMLKYPKHIERRMREVARIAYAEEMKRALGELAGSFDAWREGKIDVWELHRRVHAYHNGPARDLYGQYGEDVPVDMLVAYALVRGVIGEDIVPDELWPYLERPLAFYRQMEERDRRTG